MNGVMEVSIKLIGKKLDKRTMRKNFAFTFFCILGFTFAFHLGKKSPDENSSASGRSTVESKPPVLRQTTSRPSKTDTPGKPSLARVTAPSAPEKPKSKTKTDLKSLLRSGSGGLQVADHLLQSDSHGAPMDKEVFDSVKERFFENPGETKPAVRGNTAFQVRLTSQVALIKGLASAVAKRGFEKAETLNLAEFLQDILLRNDQDWLVKHQALEEFKPLLGTIPHRRREEIFARVDARTKHTAQFSKEQLIQRSLFPGETP